MARFDSFLTSLINLSIVNKLFHTHSQKIEIETTLIFQLLFGVCKIDVRNKFNPFLFIEREREREREICRLDIDINGRIGKGGIKGLNLVPILLLLWNWHMPSFLTPPDFFLVSKPLSLSLFPSFSLYKIEHITLLHPKSVAAKEPHSLSLSLRISSVLTLFLAP